MIINVESNTVTHIGGETLDSKVNIRQQDVDFILQILSQNFYSKPLESALREIVSNAIDANRESGSDKRVKIIVDADKNEKNLLKFTIIDNGKGISEETFNNYYLNMGASSKREDNNSIGGFGFGRFAPLAVSDIVEIKTFCEGYFYFYTMYRDALSIKFSLIEKKPTDIEATGTIVTFYYKRSNYYLTDTIIRETLMLFNNITVEKGENYTENFDGFDKDNKIIEGLYQERRVGSLYNVSRNYFSIDGAMYESKLINDLNDLVPSYHTVYFKTGELDVNPNRESILETERTLKAIEKKKEELEKYWIEKYDLGKDIIKDAVLVHKHSYLRYIDIKKLYKIDNPYDFLKQITDDIKEKINQNTYILSACDVYVPHGATVRRMSKETDLIVKLYDNFKIDKMQVKKEGDEYVVSTFNQFGVFDKDNLTPTDKAYLNANHDSCVLFISQKDYDFVSTHKQADPFFIKLLSLLKRDITIPVTETTVKEKKEYIMGDWYNLLYEKRTKEIGYLVREITAERLKKMNTFYSNVNNINSFVNRMVFTIFKNDKFWIHNAFISKNSKTKILPFMHNIDENTEYTKGIYRKIHKMASIIWLFEEPFDYVKNIKYTASTLRSIAKKEIFHPEISNIFRELAKFYDERTPMDETIRKECVEYVKNNGLHPEVELFIFNSKNYMAAMKQILSVALYLNVGLDKEYLQTTKEEKQNDIKNFLAVFHKLKYLNKDENTKN